MPINDTDRCSDWLSAESIAKLLNVSAARVTQRGKGGELAKGTNVRRCGRLFVVHGCMSRLRWQLPASCEQYHGKRDGLSVFGRYCRSSPFVFSQVPRRHGLCGSQKYTRTPVAALSSCWRVKS